MAKAVVAAVACLTIVCQTPTRACYLSTLQFPDACFSYELASTRANCDKLAGYWAEYLGLQVCCLLNGSGAGVFAGWAMAEHGSACRKLLRPSGAVATCRPAPSPCLIAVMTSSCRFRTRRTRCVLPRCKLHSKRP